jgi:hypothetical protein
MTNAKSSDPSFEGLTSVEMVSLPTEITGGTRNRRYKKSKKYKKSKGTRKLKRRKTRKRQRS